MRLVRVVVLVLTTGTILGCREGNPAFRPWPGTFAPDAERDGASPPDSERPDVASPVRPPDALLPQPDAAAADARASVDASLLPSGDALVGWWRFDEAGGVAAADSSGFGNHASVLTGAPQWTSGRVGGALKLSGASFRVARSSSLDSVAGEVTLAAWIRVSKTGLGWQVAASRQRALGTAEHYSIGHFSNKLAGVAGDDALISGVTAPAQTWVHVAVTADPRAAIFYVNGREEVRAPGPLPPAPDATPLIIGGNINDDVGTVTEHFAGEIDDLRLYRRALTAAEVARLAAP